ncbi:MAG: hypothetical protein FWG16_05965 [Micrococcales bacterium]|nr:hypothetical protein [Micrococcales bacterium]
MTIRKSYPLDNLGRCFFSVFKDEQGELESVSFDVEEADDYHYQIQADQLPHLQKALNCGSTESEIAAALSAWLRQLHHPLQFADLCQDAGVQYQKHAYYPWYDYKS